MLAFICKHSGSETDFKLLLLRNFEHNKKRKSLDPFPGKQNWNMFSWCKSLDNNTGLMFIDVYQRPNIRLKLFSWIVAYVLNSKTEGPCSSVLSMIDTAAILLRDNRTPYYTLLIDYFDRSSLWWILGFDPCSFKQKVQFWKI